MSNNATRCKRQAVAISQQTNYPWNGHLHHRRQDNAGNLISSSASPDGVKTQTCAQRSLRLQRRQAPRLFCDCKRTPAEGVLTRTATTPSGRNWKKGDKVGTPPDMEPRTVKANNKVEADRGRIAAERGPIVYCAEWPDNDFDVPSIFVNQKPKFTVTEKPEPLKVLWYFLHRRPDLGYDNNGRPVTKDVKLNLIPYYAWCHRGSGNMAVWLPQELSASRPVMPPTLASKSKINASSEMYSLSFSQRPPCPER